VTFGADFAAAMVASRPHIQNIALLSKQALEFHQAAQREAAVAAIEKSDAGAAAETLVAEAAAPALAEVGLPVSSPQEAVAAEATLTPAPLLSTEEDRTADDVPQQEAEDDSNVAAAPERADEQDAPTAADEATNAADEAGDALSK
jgi:hypothetical protein